MNQYIIFIARDIDECITFLKKEKYTWKNNVNFPNDNVEEFVVESIKSNVLKDTEMILVVNPDKEIFSWDYFGRKFANHKAINWLELRENIRKEKLNRLIKKES